jgi:signal transduction histidine kinase/ActR/RegA family two-component response regulator
MHTSEAIYIEQARLVHRNIPTAVIGGFIVASLTAAVFAQVAPATHVAVWLVAVALLSTWRMLVWRKFRGATFTVAVARHWLRLTMLGAALSGAMWGAGSFLLSPVDQFDYQLLFVWAVVMMSVAAMFSFSAYFPCFLAFVVPWVVPVMVDMALHNNGLHWGVAAGVLLFALVATRFMWTFNQVFITSLKLGYENLDLVDKLTLQKEAAEAANLAKSRFLAVASHDLRQPMHALNLYVGSMWGLDLSKPARAVLANVRQCGEAMDKMFRALLDISRLDAGTVQADARAFHIASLLDGIRMEFEPQARNKGLDLRVVSCSASVHSDPVLIERIVRNLVANAVNHTQRGKVLVGCRRHKGQLRIAVYDTGPGIEAAEQSTVFQEFYQIGNPERDRSKGLGLGLAIASRLARLLSTRVILVSQAGRGSMFAIDLPLAAEPDIPLVLVNTAAQGTHGDLAGTLVVVVDDEAAILDAMRLLLESWGCTVITAASGAQALERVVDLSRAPDVLVCDYRLPAHVDGISVIESLRAEFNEDIPAMLITGDTGPEHIRGIAASGLLVLHKPLQEDELRSHLASLTSAAMRKVDSA